MVAGQRLRRTFPTHAAARRWRADAVRAMREHRLRGPSGVTFREEADRWLADAEAGIVTTRGGTHYKPSAINSCRCSLTKHRLPVIGGLRLEDITRPALQALVDEWASSGMASSTVRNAVMPIRVVIPPSNAPRDRGGESL